MLTCVHSGFWWEDALPTISDIQVRSEGSFGASTCDYLQRCQQQPYSLDPQRSSALSTVGLRTPLRPWGIALLIWQMFLACQTRCKLRWQPGACVLFNRNAMLECSGMQPSGRKLIGRLWHNNSEMLIMLCQANISKEQRLSNTGATNNLIVDKRNHQSGPYFSSAARPLWSQEHIV